LPDRYDVIVIGTGAGGGTLAHAHALAPSGKRVLLLERGNYLPARNGELEPRGSVRRLAIDSVSNPDATVDIFADTGIMQASAGG
jgi:choline dehydrogenase-like flavoprotein